MADLIDSRHKSQNFVCVCGLTTSCRTLFARLGCSTELKLPGSHGLVREQPILAVCCVAKLEWSVGKVYEMHI